MPELLVEIDRIYSDRGYCDRLAIHKSTLHPAGSVIGLTPPPRTNIHKMSNGGHAQAISLHTYGDAGTKARVFAPVAGTFEIVDLEFHNP